MRVVGEDWEVLSKCGKGFVTALRKEGEEGSIETPSVPLGGWRLCPQPPTSLQPECGCFVNHPRGNRGVVVPNVRQVGATGPQDRGLWL